MKPIFPFLFFIYLTLSVHAQPNPEVFLVEINTGLNFSVPKNISQNPGYDNQPSFLNDSTLLFSSNRDNQTDVLQYQVGSGSKTWLTNTPQSEYSPLKIPEKEAISAIGLHPNGKQLLYRYDLKTGTPTALIENLVVGYHVWHDENTLVSFVLGDVQTLVISNIKKKTNKVVDSVIGRSLHKIPNTNLVSYISKKEEQWQIRSLDPKTGKTAFIANTLDGVEDMCWLPNGSILMAKSSSLFQLSPKNGEDWQPFFDAADHGIKNITRLVVNQAQTHLAFVAEENPEYIVQKQLDAYNARDIEAFLETYTEGVELFMFPATPHSKGKEAMRQTYAPMFQNTPDLFCEIKNRTVLGNKVIDEEYVRFNGQFLSAVAIYEVENNKIFRVTFIQ